MGNRRHEILLPVFVQEPEIEIDGIPVQTEAQAEHGPAAENQPVQKPAALQSVQHLQLKLFLLDQILHLFPVTPGFPKTINFKTPKGP